MAAKNTLYELLPPNVIRSGINVDEKLVFAITEQEEHTVKVQLEISSFKKVHCANCELSITHKELSEALEQEGIIDMPIHRMKYCFQNQRCQGTTLEINSCVAGHQVNEVTEIKVVAPKLLWVHDYSQSNKASWKLYAVKTEGGDVLIKPYRLGNVYKAPEGAVCWPKSAGEKPTNLKQAYYTYWNSPFGDELMPKAPAGKEISVMDYIKGYDVDKDSDYEWVAAPFINSENTEWFDSDVSGIFYTEADKLIQQLPSRSIDTGTSGKLVGRIYSGEEENWLFNINNSLFLKTGKLTGTSKLRLLSSKFTA